MSWCVAFENHDYAPSGVKADFSSQVISCKLQRPTCRVSLDS